MNLSSPFYSVYKEQSTANSNSFKIAQKTAFEAKVRLYTTGKVIRRVVAGSSHSARKGSKGL